MLFQISEQLPREAQGVLACCTPIPTLLRQQLQEVFMAVQEARETTITNEVSEKNEENILHLIFISSLFFFLSRTVA